MKPQAFLQTQRDQLAGKGEEIAARNAELVAKLDAIEKQLFNLNGIAKRQEQEQQRTTNATGRAATNTLARAIAYDAQDAYLVGSRVSGVR